MLWKWTVTGQNSKTKPPEENPFFHKVSGIFLPESGSVSRQWIFTSPLSFGSAHAIAFGVFLTTRVGVSLGLSKNSSEFNRNLIETDYKVLNQFSWADFIHWRQYLFLNRISVGGETWVPKESNAPWISSRSSGKFKSKLWFGSICI